MLFTEQELVKCFKENIDNEGWVYFVGNPEKQAKFIIDYMKEHKEPIDEKKLDELALEIYPEDNEFYFERSKYIDGWVDKNEDKRKAFKAGYRKAKEE